MSSEKIDDAQRLLRAEKAVKRIRQAGGLDRCPSCSRDAGYALLEEQQLGNLTILPLICSGCGFILTYAMDVLPLPGAEP